MGNDNCMYHSFDMQIFVTISVKIRSPNFQVSHQMWIGDFRDTQIVWSFHCTNPTIRLLLRINHQWPAEGFRHHNAILDGDLIARQLAHIPAAYLISIAQHANQTDNQISFFSMTTKT